MSPVINTNKKKRRKDLGVLELMIASLFSAFLFSTPMTPGGWALVRVYNWRELSEKQQKVTPPKGGKPLVSVTFCHPKGVFFRQLLRTVTPFHYVPVDTSWALKALSPSLCSGMGTRERAFRLAQDQPPSGR